MSFFGSPPPQVLIITAWMLFSYRLRGAAGSLEGVAARLRADRIRQRALLLRMEARCPAVTHSRAVQPLSAPVSP